LGGKRFFEESRGMRSLAEAAGKGRSKRKEEGSEVSLALLEGDLVNERLTREAHSDGSSVLENDLDATRTERICTKGEAGRGRKIRDQ